MLHNTLMCLQQIVLFGVADLEHHAIETVLHELLVHGHELGHESFQVVDGLAAQLQPVFVVGSHVSHLGLQLAVAVAQQLRHQALREHRVHENLHSATVVSEPPRQTSRYLHDDVRRDAVCEQLVQTRSNLQQPETNAS